MKMKIFLIMAVLCVLLSSSAMAVGWAYGYPSQTLEGDWKTNLAVPSCEDGANEHYCVNEHPVINTSDYLYAYRDSGSPIRETFYIGKIDYQPPLPPGADISFIEVEYYAKEYSWEHRKFLPTISVGGDDESTDRRIVTWGDWATHTAYYGENPATGEDWTVDELNDLHVGMELSDGVDWGGAKIARVRVVVLYYE